MPSRISDLDLHTTDAEFQDRNTEPSRHRKHHFLNIKFKMPFHKEAVAPQNSYQEDQLQKGSPLTKSPGNPTSTTLAKEHKTVRGTFSPLLSPPASRETWDFVHPGGYYTNRKLPFHCHGNLPIHLNGADARSKLSWIDAKLMDEVKRVRNHESMYGKGSYGFWSWDRMAIAERAWLTALSDEVEGDKEEGPWTGYGGKENEKRR